MAKDRKNDATKHPVEKLERRIAQLEAMLLEQDKSRLALLTMLADLQDSRRKIERARKEWTDAFDAVRDPIFLHDKDFRIVRANRAYAARVGLDIKDIIGKPYWQTFPKNSGPLPSCQRALEKEEAEEVAIPETGDVYLSRSFPVRDEQGAYQYSVHILEDVTEKRRAENALKESELRLHTVAANVQDALLMIDGDGLITFWNPAAERLFGYRQTEALGNPIHALIVPPAYRDKHVEGLARFKTTGQGAVLGKVVQLPAQRKDGTQFEADISIAKVQVEGRWHAVGVVRDITERKRAEEAVIRAGERFHMLFNSISDAIFISDMEGHFLEVNHSACERLGYSYEDLLRKDACDIDTPEYAAKVPGRIKALLEQGQIVFESAHVRKDGAVIPIELNIRLIEYADKPAIISVARDITERKRAEEALRKSAAELKEAQRVARLGSWDLDTETGNVTWSEELYRIFDRDPMQPAPGYEEHPRILAPESYARMNAAIEKTRQTGEPYELDLELVRPDGTRKWITARGEARRDSNGQIFGLRGTALDITERKRAEQSLRRANRTLQTLSGVNQALIKVPDEQSLLGEICRVIVETGGYRFAWIGYVEHDEAKSVRPAVYRGFEAGYWESLRLTWADTERGRGPTGRAIRSGKPALAQDILSDPALAPWRAEAKARGYASCISLPLLGAGEVFGVLNIYSAEAGAFDAAEVTLLQELADDLAFGILTLRMRGERDRLQMEHLKSAERLKETLTDTIRAIALTVEKRDPYTAGHQQKVAELCVVVGRELGLDENRIEGLRLGATIHDIGKIYVPAEILNRPGKLSQPEFDMIKTHPQIGYDIIKDVKFPWPVADMILQHHERLDGSGYPQGLKGEDIILEARILAVADTVEAMSSHRPYRPAIGPDKALAEIERHRGTLYDTAVVDACLRLSKEKGFKL